MSRTYHLFLIISLPLIFLRITSKCAHTSNEHTHVNTHVQNKACVTHLDKAGSALLRNGLDAKASRVGEADLFANALVVEELNQVLGVLRAALELNAGVNVLRVLAEDDHVHILGLANRCWHAFQEEGGGAGKRIDGQKENEREREREGGREKGEKEREGGREREMVRMKMIEKGEGCKREEDVSIDGKKGGGEKPTNQPPNKISLAGMKSMMS